ncbi:NAD-capped RNA hydrolase NUDT12-like isoform X1 [Haliotis asinina]|uniref:NAD-capped RNA hydrolase NUDT12-like isoform X1 n=2 Tax=Haliotis asinina TaxID=109174 RepID=UPI0035321538
MRIRPLVRLSFSCSRRMSGDRPASSAVKPSNVATQYQEQLFDSAAKGNVEHVLTLLKAAVDVDAKNDRGWTALMFAARNGQVSVIKSLLEQGSSVNILNSSGQTALDIANFWNHSDASSALSDSTVVPTQECRNYYSVNPLNRASDRRKHPEWIDQAVKRDNTKFIVFSDLNPFLKQDPSVTSRKSKYILCLFSYKQLAEHIAKKPLLIFLGLETWDSESAVWFAVDVTGYEESKLKDVHNDGFFANPFPLTMQMDERHAGIFAEARSILTWHDRYSFCATCGSPTVVREAGYKRVCDNADCRSHKGIHNTCYPRVDPSLIMLVVSPDASRCLLGRKKSFPPKMFSCLAGFMEPGECIEDTCRREVEEESGIQVGRVEYHSSQPWPFPAVLMLGCITHAKTETIKLDNDDELEAAQWFTRPEVVQMITHQHPDGLFLPPKQAIAHQLIRTWVGNTSNL